MKTLSNHRLRLVLSLFFVCGAGLFYPAPLNAQTLREQHEQMRLALDKGDNAAAWMQLQKLRQTAAPGLFAVNNYDYLAGRLAWQNGDTTAAAVNFQAVVTRNSPLAPYALWHLAIAARCAGNLPQERAYLRQLLALAPASRLQPAATTRLARSFYESGDYPAVIAMLQPMLTDPKIAATRPWQILLAQSFLSNKQSAEARVAFVALIANLPNPSQPDDFALTAARALDQFDNAQLPDTEHLRRAQIYQFNRDFAGARRHWSAIVDNYRQSNLRSNALFQIGRGWGQEGKFAEAAPFYQQILREYGAEFVAQDAQLFLAGALVRLGKTDEAITTYQKFINEHPDADNIERPYLNIIDALRDAGRDAEALTWTRRAQTDLSGKIGATLALFAQTKIHNAQGNWAEVVKDCDELAKLNDVGAKFAGGTTKSELAFMKAFALEQQGKVEDAVNAYLALPDGRNEYYGGRATLRLRALADAEKSRKAIGSRAESLYATAVKAIDYKYFDEGRKAAQDALRLTTDEGVRASLLDLARRAYAGLPAYSTIRQPQILPIGRREPFTDATASNASTVADELLFLGLHDEAAPEFALNPKFNALAPPLTPSPAPNPLPETTYTQATLFHRAQEENRAVALIEPFWRTVPADYLLELAPREMAAQLYPAPFREALLQHTAPRRVDPRFLLSIARQESRFRADAKSVAAARGMLQFISATADIIAGQLRLTKFQQDDLYDPRTAILFGAQYLGNLFQQFPAQPQAVAASYNGGEDNMARWLKRARSNDPDRYVPEINFAQSKDYVFRVLANHRVYQSLYNEKLDPL